MDESALERYFDKFIANDPRRTEEVGEEVGEEELFFKLLPDELLTLNTVTCDDADRICKEEDLTAESGIAGTQSRGSSSQKSSAEAKPTCASSSSALKALPVEPGTSEDPETLQEKWSNLVPVICNVISTVDLGCCLDLKFIARRMWNVQYRPKYFTGIIARIREPKATATIFRSGKIICLGTKSYEPELHNRLILDQITGIRVSFLSARCINVCGAKTRAEVDEIFHTVCRVLREYRWERTCSGALTSKPN
ncbi:TATA box-binding protein-like 2 isoform X2 [Neolamprologus brichardi]|uniref:TATA box-binding protein-like 2 isoform X2 n=1 Tax=Neolamprologus brichardi TaxID=32507 RepID=UPI0003EBD807|nr:TATA box-binding protein-like 2 isoform X2 [Neolamprologus brichardi]